MPFVQTFPPRRWHDLPSGGRATLTLPAKPGPVVVLLQEIFGLNEHIKEVGDRLARAGFLVATPALFHRTAPDLKLGYDAASVQIGRVHKGLCAREALLADVAESAALAAAHPLAAGPAWRLIGFCFGGLVALLAASALRPHATIACYGSGADQPLPDGSPPVLQGPAPTGRLIAVWGGQDASIPASAREALLDAWPLSEAIIEDNAGHGFLCDARPAFDPEASARVWPQLIAALKA